MYIIIIIIIINTILLVVAFLGYCPTQWKVSVKFTLVTVAHNYIQTGTHIIADYYM